VNDLRSIFPFASPDLLARNTGKASKLERGAGHAPLEAKEVQGPTGQRFLVRVVSYRKRLLDEDNLCEKYHVDLCRYAGCLFGDEAGTTKIETSQVKVGKGEEEKVRIEIYQIAP
jgi:hypothetical protein